MSDGGATLNRSRGLPNVTLECRYKGSEVEDLCSYQGEHPRYMQRLQRTKSD